MGRSGFHFRSQLRKTEIRGHMVVLTGSCACKLDSLVALVQSPVFSLGFSNLVPMASTTSGSQEKLKRRKEELDLHGCVCMPIREHVVCIYWAETVKNRLQGRNKSFIN